MCWGLCTLDREIRRWLQSAKLSEPDRRPLVRLQNPESQQRYVTYMSRLLCYSLRALHNQQEQEIRHADDISSASSDGSADDRSSDSSSEDSALHDNHDSQATIDVLKDVRRLYRDTESSDSDSSMYMRALHTAGTTGCNEKHCQKINFLSESVRIDVQERCASLSRRARDQRRGVPAPTGR